MGSCYKCNTQVTLQEEETRCDKCNSILRYWCHSCKKPFDIQDEETSNKLKECKACGFFFCPNCSICGPQCDKREWSQKIRKILGNHFYSTLNGAEILKKIVEYIEEIKLGRDRKTCPKGVPITYAKNRIKGIIIRMKGFRVKNLQDQKAFELRLQELTDLPIGKKITISEIRQEGSYGQEYRDVLNYGLCLGFFKVMYARNEQGQKYSLFERIDGNACRHLDVKDLITRNCDKCDKTHPQNVTQCDCGVYKKGKDKGLNYITKIKISNKDTCQLYRGSFNKKEKDGNI